MTNEVTAQPNKTKGKLIGVGVGPGDPLLMTLKAHQLIQQSVVISYLVGESGISQAKSIANDAITGRQFPAIEEAIIMPMERDRTRANAAYDEAAARIRRHLETGHDVAFLCEGDPLFFGSFSYLLERLQPEFECEAIPGIASINAAAAALVQPLTTLSDSFTVLSGRHDDAFLRQNLRDHATVVIMKAGQARPRILAALADTGRMQDASYLEYISRDNQVIETDVSKLENAAGPYFSLFVVRR